MYKYKPWTITAGLLRKWANLDKNFKEMQDKYEKEKIIDTINFIIKITDIKRVVKSRECLVNFIKSSFILKLKIYKFLAVKRSK